MNPFEFDAEIVYIAGPYLHPDPVTNTRAAVDAWETLTQNGYIAFCPHITLFVHFVHEHPAEFWYDYDLYFLKKCGVMLRLPGESWGADREAEWANKWDIPVFYGSAEEFITRFGKAPLHG